MHSTHINKILGDGLLHENGKALDLGCGDGRDVVSLAQLGYQVEAIDKDTSSLVTRFENSDITDDVRLKISIIETDITQYSILGSKYDVIICSNVLPFISGKEIVFGVLTRMIGGLVPKGVIYFTLFGPKDAWAGRSDMSFIEYDEAINFLDAQPVTIYERSTSEGYGKTRKGDIKYWHIHRFYCVKK